jgi:dTDP-glucose 4,6-dehydratase
MVADKKVQLLADDLNHILANTKGLWEELRGKSIFITGGTGFIGCWLLESFAWANDNLDLCASALVLTRNYDAFYKKAPHLASHPAIKFHIGDVRNFAFPDGDFSHIIHAATSVSAKLNEENPELMFDTIVEGARRTLEFAARCRAGKFLLTSSGAVYGQQPSDMTHLSEDYCGAPDPIDPKSAYGEGKRVAEHLSVLYSKKTDIGIKIARCFAFIGPYMPLDDRYAIGNFIQDGLDGSPIHVKGDGAPYRSYLYTADLAIWLWTILFKGASCCAYNVGSEEEVTIAQLANMVAQSFPKSPGVNIEGNPSSNLPVERYVPSTRLAREGCGLRQNIPLKKAISLTIQHHLNSQKEIEIK